MNRRDFLHSLTSILAASMIPAVIGGASESRRRPNVLFFLIDDMGWMDSQAYGSTYYESPAQMRLVREGVLFTDAYAAPLCSPTRAAIMSGQYPGARLHMHRAITRTCKPEPIVPEKSAPHQRMCWPESRSRLPLDVRTVAEEFKDLGYQTWFLGKWHLGAEREYYPIERGFDLNIGVGGPGPGSYFSPYRIPELPDGPDGEYVCERLTDEACKLLEQAGDKPFFMYFAHFNVHGPYQARPDLIEHYRDKPPGDNGQRHPVMGGMLHAMDQSVGKVLDKLDELDLADNTVVIFLSDNGGVNWVNKKQDEEFEGIPITSNKPLRGGKCSFYEGGVRVPLVVRWPGVVQPGSSCSTPIHAVDMYPTLVEMAGGEPAPGKLLDGESLMPLLSQTGSLKREAIFCHFPRATTTAGTVGGTFIRDGAHKLIRLWGAGEDGQDAYELYNLREDIGETNNLAQGLPIKVSGLTARLDDWLAQTGALIPGPNPAFDPAAARARKAQR